MAMRQLIACRTTGHLHVYPSGDHWSHDPPWDVAIVVHQRIFDRAHLS